MLDFFKLVISFLWKIVMMILIFDSIKLLISSLEWTDKFLQKYKIEYLLKSNAFYFLWNK